MSIPRILHYPGSKWSMTDWIVNNMPRHATYLEPFLGSGAIFFNKPPSPLETINDLDGDVVNLFRVIRDRPEELSRLIHWTPYSREEYYTSYETVEDELERARRFLIRCWMARGAKTSDRTGWRHIIDHNGPRPVRQWNEMPEKILAVTDRLKGVQLEQQPAVKLIERHNRDDVLIYADPPYILSTRNNRMYRHEMNEDDHLELLEVLDAHTGSVLLSGYDHPMYNERLKHWKRETRTAQAEGGRTRTEVLWINPVAAAQVGQLVLNF
ncbi:DNA adenine methylase [Paenibacillus alvei]|uniref:DNA adenine methylase n=1 Tax=Paenibacillus alvei TaxID=44250 RepID=UPI0002888FDD|nr:DNA adenine methylase [Paenibacillus alvei]EJW14758.1 putative methyltransferase [Paenibacillus alvei DSM 29]MCY9541834.1 DNA adenine methylase [Paenibacillus alvei]MCY9708700.1 DNA adenine methylase [Paenibacillus alvei]MCY9738107.1 DNA adenine methylase [Paenibacillus alvei]MCY9758866.1 DNA adenine methylase [Paenibacillus alvei]